MIYEGFSAFKIYLAVRNHFNTDYDYVKYKGKLNISDESFLKRKDKFFFGKLERKYKKDELLYFFIANFLEDSKNWSGSLVTNQSEQVFVEYKKRIQSLKYNFCNDCDKIKDNMSFDNLDFNSLFVSKDTHPSLLQYYMGKDIMIETIVIMDKILNFFIKWNKMLEEDFIWSDVKKVLIKYSPFLSIDLTEYRKILKEKFVD